MVTITAQAVTRLLGLIAALLAVLSLLRTPLHETINAALPFSLEIERFLHMGLESSFASWFGAVIFLAVALVLVLIARAASPQPRRLFFSVMILAMLFFAADQATSFHKRFIALAQTGNVDGYLPAAAFMVALWCAGKAASGWRSRGRLVFWGGWLLLAVGYLCEFIFSDNPAALPELLAALFKLGGAIALLHACLLWLSESAPGVDIYFGFGRRLSIVLISVTVFFTLTTIILRMREAQPDISSEDPFRFLWLFDTGQEATLPTLYAYAVLSFCAALLAVVAIHARQNARPYAAHWQGLVFVFLFLSIDEGTSIHEQLIEPTRGLLSRLAVEDGGLLYFAWVIPAALLLVVLLALYIPFLRHLPRQTAVWFILSGLLFVAGAVGLEIPSGYLTSRFGSENNVKLALEVVEELCEMLGITGFAAALLHYMAAVVRSARLVVQANHA